MYSEQNVNELICFQQFQFHKPVVYFIWQLFHCQHNLMTAYVCHRSRVLVSEG